MPGPIKPVEDTELAVDLDDDSPLDTFGDAVFDDQEARFE